MLLNCCTQYASKFGKLSSAHRTGKGQFSFQSQRKAMPKKCMNQELHDVQAGFRKGRGTRDQIASIRSIIKKKKQENSRKTSASLTKALNCVEHNNLWKILKEMGIPDRLTCLLRNLYAGQEATVRTRHGNKKLIHNWKRSMTRLFVVTLLI